MNNHSQKDLELKKFGVTMGWNAVCVLNPEKALVLDFGVLSSEKFETAPLFTGPSVTSIVKDSLEMDL